MRTYTTPEAAELTGSSVRALRKRIERGQLRAVQRGRYWRIPHAELERLGMIGPDRTSQEAAAHDFDDILATLERERAERERLAQELARLRPLTARIEQMTVQVEQITEDLHRERAERLAAETKASEAICAAEELRNTERALTEAGFFARRRMLRELRHKTVS